MPAPESRADRRRSRLPRAQSVFGSDAEAALDILELTEFAWHDCFGEATLSEAVIDDVFVCSEGQVAKFAQAARLAVIDWRDLRLWADGVRGEGSR